MRNHQKLLEDVNQTEIFELCENSAKLHCPNFAILVKENRDHLLQLWEKFEVQAESYNNPESWKNATISSIPGFVIKKSSSRGPKHGQSERQIMFFKAKEMLKKARQEKHGGQPTILARWYAQEGYRRSLAEHDIGEKELVLHDRIALEKT